MGAWGIEQSHYGLYSTDGKWVERPIWSIVDEKGRRLNQGEHYYSRRQAEQRLEFLQLNTTNAMKQRRRLMVAG